jgi:type I restriction enzyme S subunit
MKKSDALSLPKGWEKKKLGDVCQSKSSNVSQNQLADEIGNYPIFGASGLIKNVSFYHRDTPYLSIVKDGSGFGRVTKMDAFTSLIGTLQYILPNDEIDLDYLNYSLMSVDFKKYVQGAAIPHIYFKDYKNEPFLWMPLPEQQRIVAILDDAFAKIDKAKANAKQNLKNANELFESYLQAVFENGNWETKTIEGVCDEIFAGGDSPKNNFSSEENENHQIPIYANAVKDRGLYGYTDYARVTKPSITISARGSGTGHTEIRFEQYLPIVRLIVLIPNLSLINLEFLKHSIDNLEILRSGSAIPQLTVPMIKQYDLPLPSLKEQDEIVQKLDALSAETKKLEAIYEQKIKDLEELKKSVLQKAFRGELSSIEIKYI